MSGGETFWFGANNKPSPFRPTSHELMALHRVMAYQRPYMPLQDSDFLDWTYEVNAFDLTPSPTTPAATGHS